MKRVVVTEKIHPDGMALLESREDIQLQVLDGDSARLQDALVDAHAVLVRTMNLDEGTLTNARQLQIVSRHGVGCDNIPVKLLSDRNIPVAIAVDSNTTSVVEHVMMMMLALNKEAIRYDALTRSGGFSERGKYPTSELFGKHVLIVGFGRIGKRIAPVCKAFGMKVTVADIKLDSDYAESLGCTAVEDFRSVLPGADYVTLHVPLDQSTRNLIGPNELGAMPSHSILINCARGGVVDEYAVATALKENRLSAFGCDVFSVEPPAMDNPLLTSPRSIVTPHNAAGPAESMQRMATYAAQNILDHFDGHLTREFVFNADALGL